MHFIQVKMYEVSNFLLSGYVFYLCIDPEGIYFDIAHQIYT